MMADRRLAAIMFTDLVGYSALVQEDEARALALLEEHRQLLRGIFPVHDGAEVKTTGDGFLVEFPSSLRAVECAIDVQTQLRARNATTAPERRIRLRIGIHLGDVEHRDGDVVGDGVNIAARVEPLADPGGICVTRAVHDQVADRVDADLVSLGERELKHIARPVEIHSVVLPWQDRPRSSPRAAGGAGHPRRR